MEQISFDVTTEKFDDVPVCDDIDCCSLYRECSNAKKCVSQNVTISRSCKYRKKLENGVILFGKNANDFDGKKYEEFMKTYNSLSDSETEILDKILYYFFHVNPLLSTELWYYSPEIDSLSEKGFINSYLDVKSILARYSFNFIRKNALLDVSPRPRKKEPFMKMLVESDHAFIDKYVKKFRSISLSSKNSRYVSELYKDCCCKKIEFSVSDLPRNKEPYFTKSDI